MWLNRMYVWQANGLFYIYTPQGELKAMVELPNNGQHVYNIKMLDGLTKILAKGWGVMQSAPVKN